MNAQASGINGFAESVAVPVLRRTIPFDYAFRYDLRGERNLVQNSTVSVSIEAAFTAVSIGYGVVPTVQPIEFGIPPAPADGAVSHSSPPLRGFCLRRWMRLLLLWPRGWRKM